MGKQKINPKSKIQQSVLYPTVLIRCIRLAIVGGFLVGNVEQGQAGQSILPVPSGRDWVKFGKADLAINGRAMNIHQRSNKAILNWNSFNIGAKNQVNFNQPKESSIALNKIFQDSPSQILGQLNANGQVYLVNQNGFVFGKDSSVNVNTLVASSLDINDDVFKGVGITKIIGQSNSDIGSLPALESTANKDSKVEVMAGAKIQAREGGRIILAAPEVNNSGELNADKKGQILLVASQDKVYLAEHKAADSCTGSIDPDCSFNGLLVEIGTGGKVTNTNLGKIIARQGNITLAGFAVNQEGRVTATTSSKVNGTLHLQARQGLNDTNIQENHNLDIKPNAGTVRETNGQIHRSQVKFGIASLTQIGIDQEDTSAVDEQAQPQSVVDVAANSVHLEQNAVIRAPNAKVNIVATGNPGLFDQREGATQRDGSGDKSLEGKITFDAGATIDVSGAKNIKASLSRNVVDVPVQSFELRDSPYQKDGVLKGQTVRVDIRHKPSIIDIGGAEQRINRSTDERLARKLKGEVNLTAAGEVDINPNATVDVSGGKVAYRGARVETTKLMADNGKIVDISEADPNVHYKAVLGAYEEVHQKWGVTQVWRSGLLGQSTYEPGYIEGLNAGEFNIETPRLSWDGTLLAGSNVGPYQRDNPPYGGKWSINGGLFRRTAGVDGFTFNSRQNIRITGLTSANEYETAAADSAQSPNLLISAQEINHSGIRDFSAKTTGNANIDSGANILLPAKGGFELFARNINMAGKIHAASGDVNLAASWNEKDTNPDFLKTDVFNNEKPLTAQDGSLNLATGAVIDVSGNWVNDYATILRNVNPTEPIAIDGGKVALTTGVTGIDLQNGASIKADGGARLTQQQELEAGKSGQISFNHHRFVISTVDDSGNTVLKNIFPSLQLAGMLSAYGLTHGGTLIINHDVNRFIIGQSQLGSSDKQSDTFLVDEENHQLKIEGINSFGKIELDGGKFSELTLKKSATLDLQQQQNFTLNPNHLSQKSSDSLAAVSTITTLPNYLRQPVNLTLSSGTNLVLEQDSKILGAPGAQLSFVSKGTIEQNVSIPDAPIPDGLYINLNGLVSAPGGLIDIGFGDPPTDNINRILSSIWLGSHANLDARGIAVLNTPDALNHRTGEVKSGGSVNLHTGSGHVILEQGAKVNVSGTQATLDLPDSKRSGGHTVPTLVGSNAGEINVTASESVVLDGSISAHAGSSSTSGGRLNLEFLDYFPSNSPGTAHVQNILISQEYQHRLDPNDKVVDLLGKEIKTITNDEGTTTSFITGSKFNDPTKGLIGNAQISSDQIRLGGFGELKLTSKTSLNANGQDASDATNQAKVTFLDDINLNVARLIYLNSPNISWASTTDRIEGKVSLNSAMLQVGASDTYQITSMPTPGQSKLITNSQWTEFTGASNWSGFAELNFKTRHDIRTRGADVLIGESDRIGAKLNSAGNINLTASQIYPTTLSNFTIKVDPTVNPNGKITIANSGIHEETPLSAGGVLSLEAPFIRQEGTIKAPFGKLNLRADTALTLAKGSLTTVSGNGLTVPFGNILNGQAWVYPGRKNGSGDGDQNELITVPPEKKITLSSPDTNLEKGSTVDLSGGGDLEAAEFAPGIGGSFNYLGNFVKNPSGTINTAYRGGFAILPGLRSALAPYDPLLDSLNKDPVTSTLNKYNYQDDFGKQVFLTGSRKLPAGFYTILPARYALLPGAFLVTPQKGTQDQRLTDYSAEGLPVVSGYLADTATGTREPRWGGYLIENGKDIHIHSQFNEEKANTFFADNAAKNEKPIPNLPQDSGQLVIRDVQNRLALEGNLTVAPGKGGRGARVDIAADKISVVNSLSATPAGDTLELLASNLTNLGAGSLLVGGERSQNTATGATDLNISAQEVTVGSGVTLNGTDLIFAAQDKVSVLQSAQINASGNVNTGDKILNIINVAKPITDTDPSPPPTIPTNDGALIRLSADNQVVVNRINAPGQTGKLLVEQGVSLSASKSMFLDASSDSTITGNLVMNGGAISLSANTVNLGEVGNLPVTGALTLSNAELARLKVDDLVLNSRGALNLYGNVGLPNNSGLFKPITFNNLSVTAQAINGFGKTGDVAQLNANHLFLRGQSDQAFQLNGTGSGKLSIDAGDYLQGQGALWISGFNSVDFAVSNAFKAEGDGKLNIAGDLNLSANYLTAAPSANLLINAIGAVNINSPTTKTTNPEITAFGGAIAVNAASVNFNAKALLPSGSLDLHSTNGSTLVGSNSVIDLAGRKVAFADTFDYTKGGIFKAQADQGDVVLAVGSNVDLRSGGGGEASGKLEFGANRLQFLGELNAQGGSASLDVGGFANNAGFDTLMDKLMTSGVSDKLSLRVRAGDINQTSGHHIQANDIKLAADKGNINIGGTLDSSRQEGGGSVELYAGNKVTLQRGSKVLAQGNGETASGGKVLLSAIHNDDIGISIENGASVNVSGGINGLGGEITLSASRKGQDGIAIDKINGDIKGFRHFYAEGVKTYKNAELGNDGSIDLSDIDSIKADTETYMTSNTMQKVANTLGKGIQLRPGVEIDYKGDLTLTDEWDLLAWKYTRDEGSEPVAGNLAILASGALTFRNSLTDGFKTDFLTSNFVPTYDESGFGASINIYQESLKTGNSWSYQLAAGADLAAAEIGKTSIDSKNLTVTQKTGADLIDPFNQDLHQLSTVIRTGNGNIGMMASGDVVFDNGKLLDANGDQVADPTVKPSDFDPFTGAPIFKPVIYNTSVYTAGISSEPGAVYDFNVLDPLSGTVTPIFAGGFVDFPEEGGDVSIHAARNVMGSLYQNPTIQDWLHVQGLSPGVDFLTGEPIPDKPTAWGIDFARFDQNVGVFGGGRVKIEAGNRIDDLTVMAPTTGRQVSDSQVQEFGSESMQVSAGGNIYGGIYYLGHGLARLDAGGMIAGTTNNSLDLVADPTDLTSFLDLTKGPQILMGDADFGLRASRGVAISDVSDPITVDNNGSTKFFTYTAESQFSAKSLAGDVIFNVDPSIVSGINPNGFDATQITSQAYSPSSMYATAFGGSIVGDAGLMFPSAIGNLALLANQDLKASATMSEYAPALLPTALSRIGNISSQVGLPGINTDFNVSSTLYSPEPVHQGDSEPVRLIARLGDISSAFILGKRAIISSGRDISAGLTVQHANLASDITTISAGRDINFTSPPQPCRWPTARLWPNFRAWWRRFVGHSGKKH